MLRATSISTPPRDSAKCPTKLSDTSNYVPPPKGRADQTAGSCSTHCCQQQAPALPSEQQSQEV